MKTRYLFGSLLCVFSASSLDRVALSCMASLIRVLNMFRTQTRPVTGWFARPSITASFHRDGASRALKTWVVALQWAWGNERESCGRAEFFSRMPDVCDSMAGTSANSLKFEADDSGVDRHAGTDITLLC